SRHDLVRETTKNFVCEDSSRDDRTSVTSERVCTGQGRGNHVARMPPAWGEIGVVTVEIAHHHPIGKACHIGRARVTRPQHTCRYATGAALRQMPSNARRLSMKCPHGTAQRINQGALDLMHHLSW